MDNEELNKIFQCEVV